MESIEHHGKTMDSMLFSMLWIPGKAINFTTAAQNLIFNIWICLFLLQVHTSK